MITQAILYAFNAAVTFLLGLLPDLPGIPTPVLNGLDTLVSTVTGVIGLVSYLYTPTLTIFVFVALLALLQFDNVYKLVLFIHHKVRG